MSGGVGRSDPRLQVESADVIKLVMQFLNEHNLGKTLKQLQEETSVTLNTVENVPKLVGDIMHGKWDVVLEQLATVRISQKVQEDLFEQIVLELAEMDDMETAKELLEKTVVLDNMKSENPNRYLRLQNICSKAYFEPLEVYPVGMCKETQRQKIAQAIKKEVFTVPPCRLMSLVSQALKWQQHLGLLPKGAKYDLFRGDKPIERDRVERIPKKNKAVIRMVGKKTHADCAAFSPDGQFLVSGSVDGFIEVWDFDTGKLRRDLKYQADGELMMHHSPVTCIAFSRDSELLASGSRNGRIKIWQLFTGDKKCHFEIAHTDAVTSVAFNADGGQVLSSSLDKTIRIHGLRSKRMLKEFRGHESYVNQAIYSHDQTKVISCSSDGTVRVWNLKTTDIIKTFKPHANKNIEVSVRSVSLHPTSADHILIGNASNSCFIATLTGKEIKAFSKPMKNDGKEDSQLNAVSISAKGNYLYAVGDDKILYVYEVESTKLIHAMKLHAEDVLGLCHHPNRDILCSWSMDHTLKIWRP